MVGCAWLSAEKYPLSDGRSAGRGPVRWERSRIGCPYPAGALRPRLAEKHGLIDELTQWGLSHHAPQWLSWREDGLDTCLPSIASGAESGPARLSDLVRRHVAAALDIVPTDRLVLELTGGHPALHPAAPGHASRFVWAMREKIGW